MPGRGIPMGGGIPSPGGGIAPGGGIPCGGIIIGGIPGMPCNLLQMVHFQSQDH